MKSLALGNALCVAAAIIVCQTNSLPSSHRLSTPRGGTINLLWPGSSWASIACGAQYQYLAEQGFSVRHIIGASGGASSAIMMLADPDPTSLTVLRSIYTTHSKQCNFDTSCWKGVYQDLLEQTPGAFERVKAFGKVSLVCDGAHLVLYNFTDAEQAAQAYAASGGSGPVKSSNSELWKCHDGGMVKQAFPDSMSADNTAFFATTSAESATGLPSFPLFCPDSLDLILYNGYNCIDYLTNQTRIEPQKYMALDPPGIKGMQPYGAMGTWRDCGKE